MLIYVRIGTHMDCDENIIDGRVDGRSHTVQLYNGFLTLGMPVIPV